MSGSAGRFFYRNVTRRWLLALVLLIATAVPSPHALAAASGPELIVNGTMETAGTDGGQIGGWTTYLWEGSGRARHADYAAYAGGRSAHIEGEGPGKIGLIQKLTLSPCTYRLTAMLAGAQLQSGKWNKAGAVYLGLGQRGDINFDFPKGDSGWRRLEIVFHVPTPTEASIYLFNYGGGHFFADDVSLRADESCAPQRDETRLGNEAAKLTYEPPRRPEDALLSGYCADPAFAGHAVCRNLPRKIAASSDAVEKPDLVIADFAARQPFYGGVRSLTEKSWHVVEADGGSGKAANIPPGGHIATDPSNGLPGDWTGYSWLRFEVVNDSDRIQPLLIEVRDARSAGYWSRVNWSTMAGPGKSTIEMPLQVYVGEKSIIRERRKLDLDEIRFFAISATDATSVLRVSDVRLVADPGYRNDFAKLIKLDAGPSTGSLMTGFVPMSATSTYTGERGWGLSADARIGRVEDRRHPTDLLRDWVSFTRGGLDFDLPNGRYRVWMVIEDPGYWEYFPNFTRRKVLSQNKVVLEEEQSADAFLDKYFRHADAEDRPGDDTFRKYIIPRYRPVSFESEVTDGRLSIRFDANDNPTAIAVSALVIYPEADAVKGDAFIAELWERQKRQFDVEYKQIAPAKPRHAEPQPNALGGKLWVYRRSPAADVQVSDVPRGGELMHDAELQVARGSVVPLTIELFTRQDLELVGVDITLPGLEVSPGVIRTKVTRATIDGAVYWNVPRILDPLRISEGQPLLLGANTSRRLWLDIRAPEKLRAGVIRGKVTLRFSGGSRHEIPVAVHVAPWTLPVADVPVGYLGSAVTYPESAFTPVRTLAQKQFRQGLDLVLSSGFTALSGGLGGPRFNGYESGRIRMDYTRANMTMVALRGKFSGEVNAYLGLGLEGLGTYEPIDTASAYRKPFEVVLGEALDVMRRKSVMSKWLPIMHVVGDEPMGEAIGKSLALAKAFRAADPKARTSVFTSFTDPEKDERAAFAGAVDRLYLNHHSTAAINHIKSKGGECTLYNQSGRYWRGIYLLKLRESGCRGHMQFAFSSVHADPWYDLDGREADYVAVHAHRDGSLRPDIDFLRYREAVTDYRHLLKLEQSIKSAPEGAARQAAAQWLSGVLARMEIGTGKPVPWRDEEIDVVRKQAAAHISALGGGS